MVPPGVAVVGRPMPARPLQWAWSRGALPPVEWFTGRTDVVHGTNFVVPPTGHAARVATVHDLTTVHYPSSVTRRPWPTHPHPARARRGRGVHTPSAFVAAEVVGGLRRRPRPGPAGPLGRATLPAPDLDDRAVRLPPGPTATCWPWGRPNRKDLPSLVRAFGRWPGPPGPRPRALRASGVGKRHRRGGRRRLGLRSAGRAHRVGRQPTLSGLLHGAAVLA